MAHFSHRRAGALIAVLGSIVGAVIALKGLNIQVAVGIAVVAILLGTGVARGKLSGPNANQTN